MKQAKKKQAEKKASCFVILVKNLFCCYLASVTQDFESR